MFCKVTGPEHEVRLESSQMIEEIEFIEKGLEEPLASDRVGNIDGTL